MRGRQPSAEALGMVGLAGSCMYGLLVLMAGLVRRQPQATLEDDTAITQCVCEGKKAWHCARETVNLLGRPNFMFK